MKFSLSKLSKRRRRQLRAILILGLSGPVALLFCNLLVIGTTSSRVYHDLERIPERDIGVVLGSRKGTYYFEYRVQAAADLYHAGKVKHLLVSGDNHTKGYDEATGMRDALIRKGVPADAITRDFAGFRTLDSMIRANRVFGAESITVISQEFHNYRAVFLARRYGVDAVAYCAQNSPTTYRYRVIAREYIARVVAVGDCYIWFRKPKFLGPEELIEIAEGQ